MIENPIDVVIEKIASEVREAGASSWDIIKVVKELNKAESSDVSMLRKIAVLTLREVNPIAAETYESFNRMQVHTSKSTIEAFDRGNIVKSLLRETSIPRTLAEKIGHEVEEQIKNLKIKYINTSLIRELADVKLLEYGREDIHWQYTRVGMPLHEVEKKILKGPYSSKEILLEYNLYKVIPKDLAEKYFNSDIFIPFIEDFSTKPFASSIVLEKEKSFDLFLSSLISKIKRDSKHFSLSSPVSCLNFFAAQYLKKPEDASSIASILVNVLDSVFLDFHYRPAIELNLFLPEEFEYLNEFKQEAFDFVNSFLEEYRKAERHFLVNVCLQNQYQLKLLNDKNLASGIYFSGSEKTSLKIANDYFFFEGSPGILSFFGLNFSKLGFMFKGRESAFFEKLEETVESLLELIDLRKELLLKREYLAEYGIKLSRFNSLIGLHSLFQGTKEFLSKEYIDDEVVSFTEKSIDFINDLLPKNVFLTKYKLGNGIKKFNDFNREIGLRTVQTDKPINFSKLNKAKISNYLYKNRARSKDDLLKLLSQKEKIILFDRS